MSILVVIEQIVVSQEVDEALRLAATAIIGKIART